MSVPPDDGSGPRASRRHRRVPARPRPAPGPGDGWPAAPARPGAGRHSAGRPQSPAEDIWPGHGGRQPDQDRPAASPGWYGRQGAAAAQGPIRGYPPAPDQPPPLYPPGPFEAWNRSRPALTAGTPPAAGTAASAAEPPVPVYDYAGLAVSDPSADVTDTQTWRAIAEGRATGTWSVPPGLREGAAVPGSRPPAARPVSPGLPPPSFPGPALVRDGAHAARTGPGPAQAPAGARPPAGGRPSLPHSHARHRAATGPRPAVSGTGPIPAVPGTGPLPAVPGTGPLPAVPRTGPIPAVSRTGPLPAVSGAGIPAPSDHPSDVFPRVRDVPPDPGGSSRRRRGRHGFGLYVAVAGALVLVVAAAAVLGFTVLHRTARPALPAASGPAPSASVSPAASLGPYGKIASRTTDPLPLTVAQLFPASFTAAQGAVTRTADNLSTDCKAQIAGARLQSAVASGCTQVARATYLSGAQGLMATIGVLNLSTGEAATKAAQAADASDFIRQLPASSGPAQKIGQGTGIEEAAAKGHYLILIWAEFTNLAAPQAGQQTTQVEGFMTQLLQSTANVTLTSRMLTGTP